MKEFFFIALWCFFQSTLNAQVDSTVSEENEVYAMVEEMPIFPSCDSFVIRDQINQCTNQEIASYVQQVLKVPEKYKSIGLKDKVYVRFIIRKTGKITNAEAVKGPKNNDDELRRAAIYAVSLLPTMIPGKQLGIPVDVQYHVPVSFEYEEPEIFTIVEEMPTWPSCEDIKFKLDKYQCSIDKMFEFVDNKAKEVQLNDTQKGGTAMLRFLIDKGGNVSGVTVLRGIVGEPELDSIAIKIVESIPRMTPGLQKGEPVSTQYNIPVKFLN